MSLLLLADQEPAPEGESPATAGGRSSAGLAVPKTLDEKLEDAGFNRNPWLTHGEKAMLIAEDFTPGEWKAYFALRGITQKDTFGNTRFKHVAPPSEKFPAELATEGRIRLGKNQVRFYEFTGATTKSGGGGDKVFCDPVCAGGENPGVFGMKHWRKTVVLRSCLSRDRANAREAARLAALLATPSPHRESVGPLRRQNGCVFQSLSEFREALEDENLARAKAREEKVKQIMILYEERKAGLKRIAALFNAGRHNDDFDVVWEERSMIGLMVQLEKLAWELECLTKN